MTTRKDTTAEPDQRDREGLEQGIHTDFAETMSYHGYLGLDRLLTAQRPLSDSPDEMLFIIIHQCSELWMKLMYHELVGARAAVARDDLLPAYKMLARFSRIQAQIIQSWDILSTLTPSDYLAFRDRLGQASGFQSWQYRRLEFALGAKDRNLLSPHRHDPEISRELEEALQRPSIYDEAIRMLARHGFAIDRSCLERDVSEPYRPDRSVKAAWLEVYENTEKHWELYQLAEKLVDVEDWFQQWRFRHMKTVERIIGFKRGTGGSSGVTYLRKAIDRYFFPELWALRTEL